MKDLSPSLYDIAVASLVPGPQQPEHIDWLVRHQNADGSWGAPVHLSGYDNYICTYAAAVALRNVGHVLAERVFELLLNRELWDVRNIPETLTFGGLVDALDRFGRYRAWEPIPHHPFIQTIVHHEQVKWDRMVQWADFYDPALSIAGYCAERIFGDDRIDVERFITTFQVRNGSIANSPSASAMTILDLERRGSTPPATLRQYVHSLQPRTTSYLDYVPHFATAWAIMFLNEIGFVADIPRTDVEALHTALYDSKGRPQLLCTVGHTTIPGDTDSTACAILSAGYTGHFVPNVDFLEYMFHEDHYQTFLMERDSSLSTNIHMAAVLMNYRKDALLQTILGWLKREIVDAGKDTCKWHLSPMYTMGELARVMARIPDVQASQLAVYAANYLLSCQKEDGGWGIHGSTVEETGYATLGLAAVAECLQADEQIDTALDKAAAYQATAPAGYEALWIGKTLYCVEPLVPVLRSVSIERVRQAQSLRAYR